jgi:hypothetical protein
MWGDKGEPARFFGSVIGWNMIIQLDSLCTIVGNVYRECRAFSRFKESSKFVERVGTL